jgi:hypothetical protein
MFNFFKSKPKTPVIPESMRGYRYTCSCGEHTDLEWCPKCNIRNTYKWKGSVGKAPKTRSTASSSDSSYVAMSDSYSFSSDSSSSSSDCSSSSDGGSCGGGE